MEWLRWVVVVLAFLDAGYMAVDGTRALATGDYFTPTSGEHAGELGPWAKVVKAVGVEPRSTAMKTFFVVYGLVWIAVIVAFALGQPWSWLLMLLFAIGSAWYLVVGSALGILVTVMLLVPPVRDIYAS